MNYLNYEDKKMVGKIQALKEAEEKVKKMETELRVYSVEKINKYKNMSIKELQNKIEQEDKDKCIKVILKNIDEFEGVKKKELKKELDKLSLNDMKISIRQKGCGKYYCSTMDCGYLEEENIYCHYMSTGGTEWSDDEDPSKFTFEDGSINLTNIFKKIIEDSMYYNEPDYPVEKEYEEED